MRVNKNIIMACIITGVYDVNRNDTLESNKFSVIKDWANSLINLKLKGVVFHNNFTDETVDKYSNSYLQFIRITYDERYNSNTYRYFVYLNYLQNQPHLSNIFITDITDVEVVNNPFETDYYLQNKTKIFCGDEPKILMNDWMLAHGEHFRGLIPGYADFENKFKEATLLNCGIIGGEVSLMKAFLEKLCNIHKNYNTINHTGYTGDMGAFNYLLRTEYEGKFLHGEPCNTVFKAYQTERTDCWFRHK